MSPFQTFDSVDQMLEAVRVARERADAQIEDWQRELKPGDKAIYLGDMGDGQILIYSEIRDPVEDDRPFYDFDNPDDVLVFEGVRAHYSGPWAESFRATRSYSPVVPEGEFGDVHLANFQAKLTDDAFEQARRSGWPQVGLGGDA